MGMTDEGLDDLQRRHRMGNIGAFDVSVMLTELLRLRLALTVIGGLPDAEGVTHTAELDGRYAAYARGIVEGADPLPVEAALGELVDAAAGG